MLVAALVDAYVDRLFAADPDADDILVYRAKRGAAAPALGLILALCAGRDGVRLVIEADFMISLYNDHSVPRLLLALPDGGRRDMLEVLGEAVAALDEAQH